MFHSNFWYVRLIKVENAFNPWQLIQFDSGVGGLTLKLALQLASIFKQISSIMWDRLAKFNKKRNCAFSKQIYQKRTFTVVLILIIISNYFSLLEWNGFY